MAKFFVSGGTGFIGAELLPCLVSRGHELVVLARSPEAASYAPKEARIVYGDPTIAGEWQAEVAECDGALNLAGEPIVGRWKSAMKEKIRASRIAATRNLVDAIPEGKPFLLFSASGVGIYGNGGDAQLTEDTPPGDDFLAKTAVEWEAEAVRAREKGARVIIGRFAFVLGYEGGLLREIFRNARSLVGGSIGTGEQLISWVHMTDLVDAVAMLVESPDAEGVFNICAPEPVSQGELAKLVRKRVRSRFALNISPGMLRFVLGEFADYALYSQKMSPAKLVASGFSHRHTDIAAAVKEFIP